VPPWLTKNLSTTKDTEETLDTFETSLHGDLLRPGDEGTTRPAMSGTGRDGTGRDETRRDGTGRCPRSTPGGQTLYPVPCFAGAVEAGECALTPTREVGSPIVDGVALIFYTALQSMFDEADPEGNRYYWKPEFVMELSNEAVDAMVGYLEPTPLPTPFTTVSIENLGGVVSRVSTDATAHPHREAGYDFGVWGNWTEAADDESMKAWVRGCQAAIAPYAGGGVYVNYLDADEGNRIRKAFGENFDRLAEVNSARDPGNLFNHDENVESAA
jgi:hypothetical protein